MKEFIKSKEIITRNKTKKILRRGDIVLVELNEKCCGSEQNGTRYAVVIQNDTGNRYSPTTIVSFLTTRKEKHPLPTHIILNKDIKHTNLLEDSLFLGEQIRTIDKKRIIRKVGYIDNNSDLMKEINLRLAISIGLVEVSRI